MEALGQGEILGCADVHTNDLVDIQASDRLERNTVAQTAARVTVQSPSVGRCKSAGNRSGGNIHRGRYRRRGLEVPESRELPAVNDIPGQPGLIVEEGRCPDSVDN